METFQTSWSNFHLCIMAASTAFIITQSFIYWFIQTQNYQNGFKEKNILTEWKCLCSPLCWKERLSFWRKVGSSIAALQRSCQKEYTQEQNRTLTLHQISSSQKLPVRNPVWQVNAASHIPESVSGDLQRPHRNFHFLFTTSIQHGPNLRGQPKAKQELNPTGIKQYLDETQLFLLDSLWDFQVTVIDAERCSRCQPDSAGSKSHRQHRHGVTMSSCPRGLEGAQSPWPSTLGGSCQSQPWLWVMVSGTCAPAKEHLEQCWFDSLWNNSLTGNKTHLDRAIEKFSGQKQVFGWFPACASLPLSVFISISYCLTSHRS